MPVIEKPSTIIGKENQAEKLIRIGCGAKLFKTPNGEPYATYKVDNTFETNQIDIRGSSYRKWIIYHYHIETGKAPSTNAIIAAMNVILSKAQFEGEIKEVFTRYAFHDNKIYLDLFNDKREVIEITSQGWQIIKSVPVLFRRPSGMKTLPIPTKDGDINFLRSFLNLPHNNIYEEERNFKLIIGWLVGTLNPFGAMPFLALHGEQGTAKTTVTRILKGLIDPNEADARSLPKDEHNLSIAAKHSYVLAFDNISFLPNWLSDSFCRLSTGSASATRTLFTNDKETLFIAKRPIIFNGINSVASRGDLLDRLMVVSLPVIPESERRDENTFWSEYEEIKSQIFGVILDAASEGLKNLHSIKTKNLPRLADFVKWVQACSPALDWKRTDFIEVFAENKNETFATQIEDDEVAQMILSHVNKKVDGINTTTKILYDDIMAEVGENLPKSFPKTAATFGKYLNRIAPSLRNCGYEVDNMEKTSKGRSIRIKKMTAE